jgi:predicted aspartyl protease
MRGFIPLLVLALGATGAPSSADSGVPQDPPLVPATGATTPVAAADLLGFTNAEQRMTVPVSIGPSGPYPFIIDTGSERTVVSRELASLLKLTTGRRVHVTTMAGQSELGTYKLSDLRVNKIAPDTLEAPAVDATNLGAPGMLGIDALKGHSVSIDFDKNVMEVRASRKRGLVGSPDDIVIRAKNLYGQLIVTDARYRGKRISVVIDTGSPVTVGNLALLKLVKTEKSLGNVALLTVTGQYLNADYRVIDSLDIAGVGFHQLPIAFADAVPFDRFGLSNTPALMLGMDSLRLFRRVQIDFANREIRLTLPRSVNAVPVRFRQ